MNASRTHFSRQIQYDSPNLKFNGEIALQKQITALVKRRKTAQSLKQIQQWFHAVNPEFVEAQLQTLITLGIVYEESVCSHRYQVSLVRAHLIESRHA